MADAQEAVRWRRGCRGRGSAAATCCSPMASSPARAVPDYNWRWVYGGDPSSLHHRRGYALPPRGSSRQPPAILAQAAESRRGGDDSDGLYARLWQAWSLMRTGRAAAGRAPGPGARRRERRLAPAGLAMAAGNARPQEPISQVERRRGRPRAHAVREAWFYVGQWHRPRRDPRSPQGRRAQGTHHAMSRPASTE